MDTKYRNDLMSVMLAPENVIAVGEMLQLQEDWFGEILDTYIWKPLEEFAKQKKMLFDIECETGGGTGAWIYKEEWKHYGVFVWTTSRKYWTNMFVGVSWYNEPKNRKNKIFKKDRFKLNCLVFFDPNDEEWPYGWEFLQDELRDWEYNITE